jgi:UDP-3-O-[3-hydroxymyristoyl] glucosamine N-acyltransferase
VTGSVKPENSISGDGVRTITAEAIAALVGGEIDGDPTATVTGVAPLDRATPQQLSVVSAAKYASMISRSEAGVLLVDPEFREIQGGRAKARIYVKQPQEKLLAVLARLYSEPPIVPGVAPTVRIGRGARLGSRVSLGEYVVIGDGATIGNDVVIGPGSVVGDKATVGDGSRLWPSVTIYPRAVLGARVFVHAGARVGSDGFGYVFRDGSHNKIPHVGRCIVGDDVEIGANTTIDRGSIDDTVIGRGTKIDNLVHIAHNVRIGENCLIMAQVGVAGSVTVGDGAILAGQAGISGHLSIGAGARLAAQAGVFGDVPAGETWSGYPARPHRESLRASAALFKLAGMMRGLEKLLESKKDK